jgi:protein arginine kinase activator
VYCDECKKRPATVYVTKLINGLKYEGHLCAQCASKNQNLGANFHPSFAIPNFLAALFNLNTEVEQAIVNEQQNLVCDNCGLSLDKITELGRLGCSECYSQFNDRLDPLLRRIHGSSRHLGKVPLRRGGSIRLRKQVDSLRTKMQQLISTEEFEEAAKVRDEIRYLEQELGG